MLLVGCQEEHLARGVVICLECGANDLHVVPADANATLSSLASVKSRMVYLSGAGLPRMVYLSAAGLPRLSWKKGL